MQSLDRMSDTDNKLWLSRDGYLVPDTLELANAADKWSELRAVASAVPATTNSPLHDAAKPDPPPPRRFPPV